MEVTIKGTYEETAEALRRIQESDGLARYAPYVRRVFAMIARYGHANVSAKEYDSGGRSAIEQITGLPFAELFDETPHEWFPHEMVRITLKRPANA
jgi:hypothetical protein